MKYGRNTFLKQLFLGITALSVVACSRPEAGKNPNRDLKYLDTTEDIKIDIRPNQLVALVSPNGDVNTADLFHHIYVMQNLGEKTRRTTWAADSQEEFLQFYRNGQTHTKTEFKNSPYAEFLIANSKEPFMAATQNLDQIFNAELAKLEIVLNEMRTGFPFPKQALSVSQAFRSIIEFMNQFEVRINKSDLMPAFKSAILAGIYEEFWMRLPTTEQALAQFESSPDFQTSVAILRGFIDSLDVELTQEIDGKLKAASDVGQMLNKPKLNEKDAFIILVELWDQMTNEERKQNFGDLAPELYDFLNSKNKKERDCLKTRGCGDLLTKIAKKYFILPEIKKYGVNKLQQEIEASAVEALNLQTGQMATDLVTELPTLLQTEISKKVLAELEKIKSYRDNFDEFVKSEVQNWYEKKFSRKSLPSLERSRVEISYDKDQPHFNAEIESSMEISADSMGEALLASHQLFKKPRAKSLRTDIADAQIMSLMRINQMLAHGGFSRANGQSFNSLSRAMSLDKLEPLNILKGLELQFLFTMPSRVRIARGFEMPTSAIPQNFYISTQAKLLHGFTRITEVFKDWTKAPMDDLLGDVDAGELLQSIPAEDLAVPAFPKEAFLAIALGNASSVLANLKAKGSPLFIMCVDGTVIWGDDTTACAKPSALAGLISVENNLRINTVSTNDHALFLEALLQYLNMGEDLSRNTKSTYLLKSQDGSESPIVAFRKALPELRNLALGMTNFLVSRLHDPAGRFHKSFDLKGNAKSQEWADLRTQLITMNALISSAEYFRLPPYERAAVRAYHALNQNFYNAEKQFYAEKGKDSSTMMMAQVLFTMPRLLPLLRSEQSAAQLQGLLTVWENSLRGRKL